jgi:sugar lactone lactonase YvrE
MGGVAVEDLFEVHEEAFRRGLLRAPERALLSTDTQFGKGSVYFAAAGVFVWSDIPNSWLFRYFDGHVSVLCCPGNHANGDTRDSEGRLACYGK